MFSAPENHKMVPFCWLKGDKTNDWNLNWKTHRLARNSYFSRVREGETSGKVETDEKGCYQTH